MDKPKEEVKRDPVELKIPDCCREGWDSCVHCVKKPKKTKENVGL